MESTVRIEFEGLPPFKGSGPNAARGKQRQLEFKLQAQRAFASWRTSGAGVAGVGFPWDPMLSAISLSMTYERGTGTNDAANIVGGVCDALQDVAYADDKQVRHILYAEKEAPQGVDRLIVEVAALGALIPESIARIPLGQPRVHSISGRPSGMGPGHRCSLVRSRRRFRRPDFGTASFTRCRPRTACSEAERVDVQDSSEAPRLEPALTLEVAATGEHHHQALIGGRVPWASGSRA